MRLWINTGFAVLVGLLYGLTAAVMLSNATSTAGYRPNDALSTVYGLTSGAVVAFLVANLGLAAGNSEDGARDSLRKAVSGDASKGKGEWVVAFLALVFVAIGVWYLFLWVQPQMLAAPTGSAKVTQAPDFIANQAKSFIGVALAGFAAISGVTAATQGPKKQE